MEYHLHEVKRLYTYCITLYSMASEFKINEEDTLLKSRPKKPVSGIIGWLIKRKIVSTPGQANLVLVLFIIVGMIGIIYLNLRTFGG